MSEIHVRKIVAVVSRSRRIVEAHGKVEKERVEQSLEAAKAEAEFRFWDLAMQLDKRGLVCGVAFASEKNWHFVTFWFRSWFFSWLFSWSSPDPFR